MLEQNSNVSMLDDYIVGASVGNRFGISCSPALRKDNDQKYIVKRISIPQSHTQLDALLITGAYKDAASAKQYFQVQVEEIISEVDFLLKMSRIEGFVAYQNHQVVPKGDQMPGFDLFLLCPYRLSLERFISSRSITHLDAVNLGIDMCAALSACRREGMMYIDLKPSNIFISSRKGFKIGDIGFAPLKSLKFFFLQEKYRSDYTAPEMQNDFAGLNETIDTYSLGMILYQVFNNGKLPVDKMNPAPPANGDEQIRKIILKAIDPDPAKRWKDPAQMGQILVLYMQRNTINNIPIMPPMQQIPAEVSAPVPEETKDLPKAAPVAEVIEDPAVEAVPETEPEISSEPETPVVPVVIPESEPEPEEPVIPVVVPAPEPEPEEEPQPAAENDSFDAAMTNPVKEKPEAHAEEPEPIQETPVEEPEEIVPVVVVNRTEDHSANEPVFPHKPTADVSDEKFDNELAEVASLLDKQKKPPVKVVKEAPPQKPKKVKKKRKLNGKLITKILTTILSVVLVLTLGIVGYFYYQHVYLQYIDSIDVAGDPDQLIVSVYSEVEESLLHVTCSDPYGSTLEAPVVNGKAVFTDLTPGALYNISVKIDGFHKLKGQFSDIYASESYTNIANFTAVAGAEEGSVVLSITVEGQEPEAWVLSYSSENEGTIQQSFTGHSVTVSNLQLETEYTFAIAASDDSPLAGQTTLTYSSAKPIMAENIAVQSIEDGNMTVTWEVPADAEVSNWMVRCYGDGYDETLDASDCTATFTGINTENAYVVEVIAEGMTNGSRLSVAANPISILEPFIDDTEMNRIFITWDYTGPAPSGWVVMCTVDDNPTAMALHTDFPFISVEPKIPGASYKFSIQTANDDLVLGGNLAYTCPETVAFVGHAMSSYALSAKLLPTPDNVNWNYMNIAESTYTSNFSTGEDMSMVLASNSNFFLDDENACITFVIRDANGNALMAYSSAEVRNWAHMWSGINYHFAELHVGSAPDEAGIYTLEMYIDNMLATSNEIVVT